MAVRELGVRPKLKLHLPGKKQLGGPRGVFPGANLLCITNTSCSIHWTWLKGQVGGIHTQGLVAQMANFNPISLKIDVGGH